MFPPQLPNVFIRWLTKPGDTIYDPFCGRGTVLLEAVLGNRIGYGSDANPLATTLASAKVDVPGIERILARIGCLESKFLPTSLEDVPSDISMLYSPRTLSQLVYLRSALNQGEFVDNFLVAMILGIMHANHSSQGATRGLSISMPNTFAMSPGYVRSYIARHHLAAPDVDVFQMLRQRARKLDLPPNSVKGGRVWQQDATDDSPSWLRATGVKLVFTSPPYLEVIKYGKYNWVRLWFLGHDPKTVDAGLMATSSLRRYVEFMDSFLRQMSSIIQDDGYVCLVIGDVRQDEHHLNLADEVWKSVAHPQGWHLLGVVSDALPVRHKVSRIWRDNPGRATKTDRILILCQASKSRRLPPIPRMTWEHRLSGVNP